MDCLLFGDIDSSGSVAIQNFNIVNDAILNAMNKYGEMFKIHEDVKRFFSDYQRIYNKITFLNRFQDERRSINIRIRSLLVRINELIQAYKSFIELALNEVRMLGKMINDANIPWEKVHIERKIKLIKKFINRLTPCIDLLNECDVFQPIVFNVLTGMRAIFDDVNSSNNFISKFKELLDNQGKEVKAENYKLKLNLLSNKIEEMSEMGLEEYNSPQESNEINDINLFENVLNDLEETTYMEEFEGDPFQEIPNTAPNEHRSRKRKFTEITVSVVALFI